MQSLMKLNQLWSEIIPQKGSNVVRRSDPNHPLDIFIGFDDECRMMLFLISEYTPDLPESSQHILVRSNQRDDGKVANCFILTNANMKDLFISLCWDLMDFSYGARSSRSGIDLFIKRFRLWQMLLAEGKNKKMPQSLIHGLIGELWVLLNVCMQQFTEETAVAGWIGPIGSDRDFEYENTWFEVKTTTLSSDAVSISSLDQLDVEREGTLLICRIEKTAETNPNSITLLSLVNKIQSALTGHDYTLSIFSTRLFMSGFIASDEGANESYSLSACEQYRVSDSFPRIRRSTLPIEIINGKYTLSIASIQNWRMD